jgi:hypothetical protein
VIFTNLRSPVSNSISEETLEATSSTLPGKPANLAAFRPKLEDDFPGVTWYRNVNLFLRVGKLSGAGAWSSSLTLASGDVRKSM